METFSICYHGTLRTHAESIMSRVNVKAGRLFTDFGQGFYLTTNYEQAKRWAVAKARYRSHADGRADEAPVVVKIRLDTISLHQLSGCTFEVPNDRWAEFVYNCRKHGKANTLFHNYDFVCGPLADGKFLPLFNKYDANRITFEEFHAGIKPINRDHNQLSLHTMEAISCIHQMEVERIETTVIGSNRS
ncbi:MAG TPA: DUF3990 domain-containing protein [Bacilli bacterium]|nr:DUF3990 domain-containing protein [Bacilli bacterium]